MYGNFQDISHNLFIYNIEGIGETLQLKTIKENIFLEIGGNIQNEFKRKRKFLMIK